MTKYNLYFGGEAVEYYKPATPEDELQTLIDDPEAWKQYKENQEDALKLVSDERDNLVKEKTAMGLLFKKRGDKIDDFNKFLKDNLGYDTLANAINALGGYKLIDILKDADAIIKTLRANEIKLRNDIGLLNTRMADMVDRELLIAEVEKTNNYITQLNNSQTAFNSLDNKVKALNTKWGTADINAVDALITRYRRERNDERTKIDNAKLPLKSIAEKINSWRSVLPGKKQAKTDMRQVGVIFGWSGSVLDIADDASDNA